MPPPMPTVVHKGEIFRRYDLHYTGAGNRLEMLLTLKRITSASVETAFEQGGKDAGLIDTGTKIQPNQWTEWQHVLDDWLGHDGKSFFRVIKAPLKLGTNTVKVTAPTQAELAVALKSVVEGIIQLLQVSLGLDDGDWNGHDYEIYNGAMSTNTVLNRVSSNQVAPAPRRDLRCDIYWVCGKLDGFECVVSWNEAEAALFITTPPIKDVVGPFAAPTTSTLEQARRDDVVGMLLVRPDSSGAPRVRLLALNDGGITP